MNEADSSFCERDGTPLQQNLGGIQSPAQIGIPSRQISGVLVMPDRSEIQLSQPSRVFGRTDFIRQLKPENVKEVSRAHFTITCDFNTFYIQDGGPDPNNPNGWKPSVNRTILNGVPLDAGEKRKLNEGDVIDVASQGLNMTFRTR
jgi:pSer/pThr/pTyr-binding forkhead associated (FHA) protein